MVQYVGIKTNKSALMSDAWTRETKQVGMSFNSRKAIKPPSYLWVGAGDSEMDASINSAEKQGCVLGLALFSLPCTGAAQERKIFFSQRFPQWNLQWDHFALTS